MKKQLFILCLLSIFLLSCRKDREYYFIEQNEINWFYWGHNDISKEELYNTVQYELNYIRNTTDTIKIPCTSLIIPIDDNGNNNEIGIGTLDNWGFKINVICSKNIELNKLSLLIDNYSGDAVKLNWDNALIDTTTINGIYYSNVFKWENIGLNDLEVKDVYFSKNHGLLKITFTDGEIYELLN